IGPGPRIEASMPGTVQIPEPSAVTVVVTVRDPSPMVTCTVELGSAVPVKGIVSTLVMSIATKVSTVGAFGATVSLTPVRVPAGPVLPAASVAVAATEMAPSFRLDRSRPETVQFPPAAVAEPDTEWDAPSDTATATVEPASAVPEKDADPTPRTLTAA